MILYHYINAASIYNSGIWIILDYVFLNFQAAGLTGFMENIFCFGFLNVRWLLSMSISRAYIQLREKKSGLTFNLVIYDFQYPKI